MTIRRPVMTDADYSFRWFSNPEVNKYLPLAGKGDIPLASCRDHIRSVMDNDRPEFAVTVESHTGVPVGCGGFRNLTTQNRQS